MFQARKSRRSLRGATEFVQTLESRRLFCSVGHVTPDVDVPQYVRAAGRGGPEVDTGGLVWSNRGTTDNFAAFGTQADAARQVVDAAFTFWQRTMGNFNQDGGNDQIDVTITVTGSGVGGGGSVTSLIGSKPRTGAVTIGSGTGANGAGFYIDPTPYDFSEFQGQIFNAFSGRATATTPPSAAQSGNDLFTLVSAELQHTLGITSTGGNSIAWRTDPNDYLRLTSSTDGTDTPGNLWVVKSPRVRALMTSNNGGAGGVSRDVAVHSAKPTNSVFYENETYTGVIDTGGASYNAGERYLPSYNAVMILGDLYGYTVNPPQDVNGSFYAVPDSGNRQVIVRNDNATSSDRMEVRTGSGGLFITLDIGNDVAGTNLNGPFVVQFTRLAFDKVVVNGGGGDDFLRVDGNDFLATTVNGGEGNDIIDLGFVQKNLDLINGTVVANGENGYDRIFIYDDLDSTADTFTLTSTTFDSTGSFNLLSYATCEEINPRSGSAADTINITSTLATVFVNNFGGNDTINIGSSNGVQSIAGGIQIDNPPAFSVVNINNTGDTVARNVTSGTNGAYGFIAGLAPNTISFKYADVSAINVTLGNASDTVAIPVTGKPITFTNNNGGNDTFIVGNSSQGTGGIVANLRLLAFGFAANFVVVDNFGGANRTATLAAGAGGEYVLSGFTGGGLITYNRQAFNSGESFAMKGGFGNESLSINNVNDPGAISFDGRGGFDTLVVDDRLQSTNIPTGANFHATGIFRFRDNAPFPATQLYSTTYANMDAVTFYAHPSSTMTNVYGVPSSIPSGQQATIILGNNADSVNMFPHDANGDLTINGNIGIVGNGGVDIFRVRDNDSDGAINYSFSNPFGSGTQNLFGLGLGGVGTATIETWEINGGTGNDTFAINQFTSGVGLGINGGGGSDVAHYGNNGVSAITAMAFFSFNGQGGSDTFALNNQTQSGVWTYNCNLDTVTATSTLGASYLLNTESVEAVILNGGAVAGETFNVNVVPAGTSVVANGGAGQDWLRLGPATNKVDAIQGPVTFNAQGNGGNVVVFDQANTIGKTFHQNQTTLGGYAGDNLFGPGGSLTFSGLTDLSVITPALLIHLGGGSDTAYAQPLASGTVTINYNGQNFSESAGTGDGLNLALAAATNYVISGTTSGNVVSDTTGRLNWNGIELPVAVDDVAPTALGGEFEYDVPQQSLTFTFDEDVSANLNTGYLVVTNLDTGEQVSQGVMQLDYDASANIATVTFPGLPNGALPDGNYHATLLAGYTDLFGNASTLPVDFDFFTFAGDATRDRTIGIADFSLLAANFNLPGTFSTGDFNYSGTVEIGDFSILASKFNTTLPDPPTIARSPRTSSFASHTAFSNRLIGDILA